MDYLETENTSLFEELYTGLNHAIEFVRGKGEAKMTFTDNVSTVNTVCKCDLLLTAPHSDLFN